jgi:uncharacterized membrane protein HdeD (DUF308 family)
MHWRANPRKGPRQGSGTHSNWWAFICAGPRHLLGLAAFCFPVYAWRALVVLFGAYAVVDGVGAVVAGVRAAEHRERGSLLPRASRGIAAGVLALWRPSPRWCCSYLMPPGQSSGVL